MLSEIKDYFEGKGDLAPVDLSNGGFFVQLTKTISATEKLEQGGTIMYVILGVGIFAILLGLERIIVLGTKSKASAKVMNEIKNMANQGNWKEAQKYCSSKSRIPTCQMLDSAMDHVGASQDVLENALTEGILRQVPKLERFIPTLALFAVVSPLLGLLGTVSGMIKTFEIITEVGTGDPGMLAGGISEALLTTQFGLVVAIPIMLVHHFLKSQVDKIVNDMEEKGTAFIITLSKESGNSTTKEA
jgi:biopolymer transport protein ExbB